jgi:hypothetical protein
MAGGRIVMVVEHDPGSEEIRVVSYNQLAEDFLRF